VGGTYYNYCALAASTHASQPHGTALVVQDSTTGAQRPTTNLIDHQVLYLRQLTLGSAWRSCARLHHAGFTATRRNFTSVPLIRILGYACLKDHYSRWSLLPFFKAMLYLAHSYRSTTMQPSTWSRVDRLSSIYACSKITPLLHLPWSSCCNNRSRLRATPWGVEEWEKMWK